MQDAAPVRAQFPLTVAQLGPDALVAWQRGEPIGFLDHVNARFGEGTIAHRAVRDLARYEAERARLAREGALAPPAGPLPEDAKLRLAPAASLLMYGADLPGMLASLREGRPGAPRPKRGWILLVPRGGGRVEERLLTRDDEGWLLEWFRDPTPVKDVMAMWDEDREPFDALWREGLLVVA